MIMIDVRIELEEVREAIKLYLMKIGYPAEALDVASIVMGSTNGKYDETLYFSVRVKGDHYTAGPYR